MKPARKIGEEPVREQLIHKRLFVEFGHGGRPAPIIHDSNFNNTTIYVGIDTQTSPGADVFDLNALEPALQRNDVAFIVGNKPLITGSRSIGNPEPKQEESEGRIIGETSEKLPLINNFGHLELADETADTVLAANLLGDPSVFNNENPQQFQEIVWSDLLRILKVDGNLIILETRTPVDLVWLQKISTAFGLETVDLVKSENSDWLEKTKPYGGDMSDQGKKGCYMITFKVTARTPKLLEAFMNTEKPYLPYQKENI